MTYEEAKKLIARAEELAQAVKDGSTLEMLSDGKWVKTSNYMPETIFKHFKLGYDYRIAKPKTRRPWTQAESEAHLGWVLVAPDGKKQLFVTMRSEQDVWWIGGPDPSLKRLAEYGWQVHPAGHPDQLKSAYVEE